MKFFGISVLAVGTLFLLGGCSTTEETGEIVSESGEETIIADSSGDELIEDNVSLKDDGYFKELVRDGENPKITDIVSYHTDYTNSDWDKITLDVEHVKIVNVADYKDSNDTEYKELLSLKYQLTNEDSEDKHIKPDKAVLVLKDNTKVDAEFFFDYWDDEVLTKDKHKDGYIHFKVKGENTLSDIKKLELTFKAEDSDSKEVTHTYTIDLPLHAD